MAMESAAERFFREGVFRYAEARALVASYESTAQDKVADVAMNLTARLLRPKAKPKIIGKGFCNGDDGGRVAYATFPGQLGGEEVSWEIGIWWAHPSDGNDVVVYAECWKGPDHLAKETWAHEPRSTGKWVPYAGGLHLHLEPGEDVEQAFRKLLDEVADQSASKRR